MAKVTLGQVGDFVRLIAEERNAHTSLTFGVDRDTSDSTLRPNTTQRTRQNKNERQRRITRKDTVLGVGHHGR